MNNMDNRNLALIAIQDIFRKELEDSKLVLTFDSSASSIEKWDSINNLILITSIEEQFEVSFPIEVIFTAKNVGDLCDYVIQNSATFKA